VSLTVPEITPVRTLLVNVRVVRDEFLRFGLRIVEVDPDAEQPADPYEPRIKRPYNLAEHDVRLDVKRTTLSPTNLLTYTRGEGLLVDDAAGRILVDISDEETATMGLDDDGIVSWDHAVYKMRVEQPAQGDGFFPLKGEWSVES
jgi:hypothetical protein